MIYISKLKLLILTFIFFFNNDSSYGKMIKLETEHFLARFDSETEEYVLASLKVLGEVRELALKGGFDLPHKIKFEVIRSDRNVLWVDKKKLDKIIWEYKSLDNFLPPLESAYSYEFGH